MGSIQIAELKKEAEHYSFTGGVVSDPFWHGLEHRFEANPERFASYHPNLVGFLAPPKCIGELPSGPFLDGLRKRFDASPDRFTRYHPFWGPLLAREAASETSCLMAPPITVPPPASTGSVPEPASVGMLAFCLAAVWMVMIRRKWRSTRDA